MVFKRFLSALACAATSMVVICIICSIGQIEKLSTGAYPVFSTIGTLNWLWIFISLDMGNRIANMVKQDECTNIERVCAFIGTIVIVVFSVAKAENYIFEGWKTQVEIIKALAWPIGINALNQAAGAPFAAYLIGKMK